MAFAALSTLRTELRRRLNDVSTANFLDSELDACLNIAYRESTILGRCHKIEKSVTLVFETPTSTTDYDVDPIFEVIQVMHNSIILAKTELADVGVYSASWATTTPGTPTKWMQLTGSTIRVSPGPDETADDYALKVYGYAVDVHATNLEPLTAETDTIEVIPEAFGQELVLDRAEAEARSYRVRYGMNMQMVDDLTKKWLFTIEALKASNFGAR